MQGGEPLLPRGRPHAPPRKPPPSSMLFMAPVNEHWSRRGGRGVSTGAESGSVEAAVHVTCGLIGLAIAVAVSLLHSVTSALSNTKMAVLIAVRAGGDDVWACWACLVAIATTFGLGAYACVICVPHSRGSGLPQLIAYLNGIKIDGFTSAKVLLAKLTGTALAIGGGFYIGPEGPIIHSGACIGKCLLLGLYHLGQFRPFRTFRQFRNDVDQRDFVAIGAGAGVAAAFMAPVSGIIFVVEEASTHFSLALLWRAFFAAIVAIWASHWVNLAEVRCHGMARAWMRHGMA